MGECRLRPTSTPRIFDLRVASGIWIEPIVLAISRERDGSRAIVGWFERSTHGNTTIGKRRCGTT